MAALSSAGVSFLIAVIVHLLCAYTLPSVNRVKSFLIVGILVGLVLGTLAFQRWSPDISICALASYALLCELYLFAFTLALGSISANLLLRIRERPLPVVSLNQDYSGELMTALRLERLCASGLLQPGADGWVLTNRGRQITECFSSLREFFRHDQASRQDLGT